MAIKISGTTVIDDSRNLVNINSGLGVGIQSAGSSVGYGITQLNFAGVGNTFSVSGSTATITISSGGGGSLGVSSSNSIVSTGVTNLNFVGVAVTAVGLTTAVVTIAKNLTIGKRIGNAVTINLTTSSGNIVLRDGSSAPVPV